MSEKVGVKTCKASCIDETKVFESTIKDCASHCVFPNEAV